MSLPQDTWINARKDGNGDVVSGAIHCANETFNPITGFVQEEKFMLWVKATTLEIMERQIKSLLTLIKKGTWVPLRVFSETPMYEGHQPDVNPSTNEPMDRYSQTRLGTAEQARTLHRTFVEVSVDTEVKVDSPEVKVAVNSGAEDEKK